MDERDHKPRKKLNIMYELRDMYYVSDADMIKKVKQPLIKVTEAFLKAQIKGVAGLTLDFSHVNCIDFRHYCNNVLIKQMNAYYTKDLMNASSDYLMTLENFCKQTTEYLKKIT